MNRVSRPAALRAALILLLPALVLAGCGRKGPLELPPTAGVAAPPPAPAAAPPGAPVFGMPQAEPARVAPTPPQNRFFLDWLLN